jgi:glycine cleavage system H protein
MGDVVYVELPDVGRKVAAGDDFVVVESVKGANDVFSPVSGTVTEVNEELDGAPELVNQDPYANWLVKLKVDDPSEADGLLDAAAYKKLVEELEAEGS